MSSDLEQYITHSGVCYRSLSADKQKEWEDLHKISISFLTVGWGSIDEFKAFLIEIEAPPFEHLDDDWKLTMRAKFDIMTEFRKGPRESLDNPIFVDQLYKLLNPQDCLGECEYLEEQRLKGQQDFYESNALRKRISQVQKNKNNCDCDSITAFSEPWYNCFSFGQKAK